MTALPTLPPRTLESWRLTNLARAVEGLQCTPLCTTPGCLEAALPVVVGPQLVFHNGVLAPAFSHPFSLAKGATYTTGPCPEVQTPLDTLDTWKANECTLIHLPAGMVLPMHLVYAMSGPPSTARIKVVIAPGAHVTLLEHHVAAPRFASWQHVGVELELGEGATLTHTVLQVLPPRCLLTRRTRLTLAAGATVTHTALQAGGAFSRQELHSTLDTTAHLSVAGLGLTRHRQIHDMTLTTTFTGEANTADICQTNLLDDAGHAIFQGKYHVHPAAQKTDATMHVHSLLLGPEAKASHKPELQIYADDVRCTHGAASGGLNADHLFYLQSRGLTSAAAQRLLLEGFAREAAARFPDPAQPFVAAALARFLTEAPHAPQEGADFVPLGGDFMTERAEAPLERVVEDSLLDNESAEIRDA